MLVLAHRAELLHQARDKQFAANPALKVEIEQAGQNASCSQDLFSHLKSRVRSGLTPFARAFPEISLPKTSLQAFPPTLTSRTQIELPIMDVYLSPGVQRALRLSAHVAMVWATWSSSPEYIWSAFLIMTVFTRLGPFD